MRLTRAQRAVVLQQQRPRPVAIAEPTPWQDWDAATIAACASCPVGAVQQHWPSIYAALELRHLDDRAVCAAAIATVAIESASTFGPVREAFWNTEEWRRLNLRYWPYYGRGYVQLTWETNYATYGQLLGLDLVADPDRALEPDVAAEIFAEFFLKSGAAAAARRLDWAECRRCVQGGDDGLDRLVAIVARLGLPS